MTKCCSCNKELDIQNNSIPPTWYGKFNGKGLIKAICSVCIKDEKKVQKYKGDEDDQC